MTYDVFISYSYQDAAWAARLDGNLTTRGLNVFRDQTRLNAGDEWDATLRDAIVDSRSLVVLWSDKASESKWVMREQESFRQMMHVDARNGEASVRRMVQVCLQGSNPEYPAFQTILDLHANQAYPIGAAQVDPNLWNRVMDKVETGVTVQQDLPRIQQVILASTRARLAAVTDDYRAAEDAAPFSQLVDNLNFPSREDLLSRYGAERSEWRPFGGQKTILALMSELRQELIGRGCPPFLWQPVREDLWAGVESKRNLRDLLKTEPCVVVLDPVSLYDAVVWQRYDLLLDCLNNPKAAIVVLPPFASTQRDCMRTILEAAAAKMFEPFYRPDRATVPIAANCSVLADDPYEVSRVVAAMIRTAFRKEKSDKLRFGPRR